MLLKIKNWQDSWTMAKPVHLNMQGDGSHCLMAQTFCCLRLYSRPASGESLQWCKPWKLSCLCWQWQSCPLCVHSRDGKEKGQWKEENGNLPRMVFGLWEAQEIAPPFHVLPQTRYAEQAMDPPPPFNPQHTYTQLRQLLGKQGRQKFNRKKKGSFCILDFKDFHLVPEVYDWPWHLSWLSTSTDWPLGQLPVFYRNS